MISTDKVRTLGDVVTVASFMAAANSTDPQDWKKKYFDSLDSLEGERQKFRATEAALKRLAGRLCIASLGQSVELDAEVKKLQSAIRRESTSDELDKLASAFTDAINQIDSSSSPATALPSKIDVGAPPESARRAIVGEERLRATLATLIADLRRDPALIIQADAVDARLATSMTVDNLPDVLSSLTELVGQRIQRIERAKREVEALLSLMVEKLDEIGRFVVDQTQNQNQSLASSESLNTQLVGEMKAMGESVESAVDVSQIRTQVRSRLDVIGQHLQEFRQRETARANEMRARNEQMQARVVELEAKAKHLHDQLKDEQRLSTIDALTNIPNRLAYEKRIEEELKRWQRFKQPTCLAVWDIDRFKHINDSYGHRAGDRVLRAVAECMAARIRSTDFLARFGGEEFVMILCGAKLEDAMRLVDEMRVVISQLKFHHHGTPLPVTISSGVTTLLPNDSAAAAFDRADKALYQAKESGRNRCLSN